MSTIDSLFRRFQAFRSSRRKLTHHETSCETCRWSSDVRRPARKAVNGLNCGSRTCIRDRNLSNFDRKTVSSPVDGNGQLPAWSAPATCGILHGASLHGNPIGD